MSRDYTLNPTEGKGDVVTLKDKKRMRMNRERDSIDQEEGRIVQSDSNKRRKLKEEERRPESPKELETRISTIANLAKTGLNTSGAQD